MTRPLATSRAHTLALGADPLLRRRFMVTVHPVTYAEDARYLDAYRRNLSLEPPRV